MIRFRDIVEGDRELFQSYTLTGRWRNCDLSFPNMISWSFLYGTQMAIVDGHLVTRFWVDDQLAYTMPLPGPAEGGDGKERDFGGFRDTVNALREDAAAMGCRFLMLAVRDYVQDLFEESFPGEFEIETSRDRQDYVYLRERLESLSGRKLQQKRNHVNKFRSLYPQYEYREITPGLIPQCLELARKWKRQAIGDETLGEESLLWELRAMKRALHRWEALGYIGGAIFVDGDMVAFSYGCPVNGDTFDVCVEKADTSYPGAFNIINQEFVRHLPPRYTHINREEDLGDEGLRKAKLSYRPEAMLDRCAITEREPIARRGGAERIRRETMAVWKEVFGDPDWFIDLYFSRLYRDEYNTCSQVGGRVVAALQALPHPMLYHGREVDTAYISGVGTLEGHRRKGIAGNLLKLAHLKAHRGGVVFTTLIPAGDRLRSWYSRHGYSPMITCTPAPVDIMETPFAEYDALQRSWGCAILHDSDYYEVAREDIRLAGGAHVPQAGDIQAMLRVVNAQRALELYAEAHPDASMAIRINGDTDIPMNNSFYLVENGKARQTDEPDGKFVGLTIGELAEMVFRGENARMCLMMN